MFIPVVFCGGQYNHLIVRALRELGVESRLVPMTTIKLESLEAMEIDGLVMGGGPYSVRDGLEQFGDLPRIVMEANFPILGICLTHQLIGKLLGGEVVKGSKPEFGKITVYVIDEDDILRGLSPSFEAWASHNDEVVRTGKESFEVLAYSDFCSVEALKDRRRPIYGVQFHIEVADTPRGKEVLSNFIEVCRR